jgi:hypothetical protein
MSYSGESAQEEGGNNLKQELLTKEEIDSLKEYCQIFDKIMVSKNPAVREAWKDISLLIGLTEPIEDNGPTTRFSPKFGGPFSRLAQTVERSLMIHNDMNRHVSGLQYQIDQLKKEMKSDQSSKKNTDISGEARIGDVEKSWR